MPKQSALKSLPTYSRLHVPIEHNGRVYRDHRKGDGNISSSPLFFVSWFPLGRAQAAGRQSPAKLRENALMG